MYSKVIVPLDESELSEQALPYAELMAASLSAPLELVQAYDFLTPGFPTQPSPPQALSRLQGDARRRAAAFLEPVRQRMEAAGLDVSMTAQHGQAADIIAVQAGFDPDALVVMSTHGRGGISRWAMGSVTDRVLHTIPNPMLIVRSTVTGPASPVTALKSVIVPLDGSALSERAIPHAVILAATLSARITVLRITPTREYYRRQLTGVAPELGDIPDFDPGSPEALVAEDAEDATEYLNDINSRMAIDHAHGVSNEHILSENVAQTIIERAAAEPSLVVMTTHGRSGVGRLVLGSVTDRVIRHSNAPVLVIR